MTIHHSSQTLLKMSASAVQASIKTALGALPSKFSEARSSGALYFFDSDVKYVEQDGNRVSPCSGLRNESMLTSIIA